MLRQTSLLLVLLAGALALILPVAAEETAAITLSCPSSASSTGETTASVTFSLPAGCRLARNPSLRVKDASGALVELLPVRITQALPNGKGQRALHTAGYAAGAYTVTADLEYVDSQGDVAASASAPAALTVSR